MRKSLLAAMAATALVTVAMVGCTTTPYGYDAGYDTAFDDPPLPPAYYPDDRRLPPGRPYDDRAYSDGGYQDDDRGGRRAYRGDSDDRRYGRRHRRDHDRRADLSCQAGDPRDCPAPADGMVQPLPSSYYAEKRQASPRPAPARAGGQWRIQLGAFSQDARAASLRARLAGIPALARYQTYLIKGGGMTRVQAGPLPGAAAARQLCARVRASGHACIVKAG